MATLSYQEARQTYDRIGARQDSQAYYEDPATNLLLRHANFGAAQSVFEFGCGTGRFAHRLLADYLPESARYRGVDISPTMVRLAQSRLAPYSGRTRVVLSEGGAPVDEASGDYYRFVSNYVFDLLSDRDIRAVVGEAHRMLRPGGLLCLTGLSGGSGWMSRMVAGAVTWIHSWRPALVGGCRPLDLVPFLAGSDWQLEHHEKVVAYGIPSDAVVAKRR